MTQLYEGNVVKTFSELRREYNIPYHTFYRYLQIRHALEAQFKTQVLIWSKTLLFQKIFKMHTTKGLISKIYGQLRKGDRPRLDQRDNNREKWEADTGEITNEQ